MSLHSSKSLWLAGLLALGGCAGNPPSPEQPQESAAESGPEARFSEAVSLLESKRYQEAASAWERLVGEQSAGPAALANLAIAYMHLGREQEAIAALEKALAADPAHPQAGNLLAIQHRKAGRFEEARALYQRVLDAHPDYRNGHLNLAILCDLYLQQLDCAREHYLRYQSLSEQQDEQVTAWLVDLERRLPEEGE